nr:uncharacterized protein LOC105499243 isoform X2 [Macaca nemestrina]
MCYLSSPSPAGQISLRFILDPVLFFFEYMACFKIMYTAHQLNNYKAASVSQDGAPAMSVILTGRGDCHRSEDHILSIQPPGKKHRSDFPSLECLLLPGEEAPKSPVHFLSGPTYQIWVTGPPPAARLKRTSRVQWRKVSNAKAWPEHYDFSKASSTPLSCFPGRKSRIGPRGG